MNFGFGQIPPLRRRQSKPAIDVEWTLQIATLEWPWLG